MMKKKITYFMMAMAMAFISSCSDDDDTTATPDPDPLENNVVINEVSFQGTDWIEIANVGTEAADISDYWLCLGPQTYRQINTLDALAGNTTIPVGGFVVIGGYDLPDTDGGLGLYRDNSDFTDASTLADFVQYGSGGSSREDVAVAAGEWTAGEFVPVVTSAENTIIFDGTGNSAADWSETTTPTVGEENILTVPVEGMGIIVLNEFRYQGTDWVEIANLGTQADDVSDYWLCTGMGTYRQISTLDVLAGETTIPAGGFVVVAYNLPDDAAGLGLYSTNSNFTDPDTLLDFVQYGAAGTEREDVAAEAGIWTLGEFVPGVRLPSFSIAFDGEGDTASDWAEAINPTVAQANNTPIVTTTFNITVTNSINLLGATLYNTPQNLSANRSNPDRASLDSPGEFFEIEFVASPGANMNFVSMSSISNDWLFAPKGEGVEIFDATGAPVIGDITDQIYLWDAGTEEENPETFGGGNPELRQDDDDNTVRVLETDVSAYLSAELTSAVEENGAYRFTLVITNLRGEFGGLEPTDTPVDPIRISPGILTLHAQDDPVFTAGQPDRGNGLQLIAERGNIMELWEWLNEEGTDGAPLRLASSWSTISPGIVYAFNTDTDPWFTEGEAMVAGSGVEELAEAGNNQVAFDFINAFGIPVTQSDQTTNLDPGESLTFSIEVPQGQNYKLGFSTMLVRTNDWFMSFSNNGVTLWDENGTPLSGTSGSERIYLFDGGTEEDELVGIGDFLGTPPGPIDDNTIIRRVMSVDDQQFGKGVINSAPGTAWIGDPRGGYNLLEIDVQPQ